MEMEMDILLITYFPSFSKAKFQICPHTESISLMFNDLKLIVLVLVIRQSHCQKWNPQEHFHKHLPSHQRREQMNFGKVTLAPTVKLYELHKEGCLCSRYSGIAAKPQVPELEAMSGGIEIFLKIHHPSESQHSPRHYFFSKSFKPLKQSFLYWKLLQ